MSSSPEGSFFNLMLTPTLRFNKLRIPKDFASEYYEELDAYCYLEVPTGVTHQVELDEEDDELWFGNGLEEFINAFSIRFGYFMLFIYQGDSNFLVHIYDLTGCEISYKRRHDSPSLGSCEISYKRRHDSPSLGSCEISYKRRHDSPSLGSCEDSESEIDVSIRSPGSDMQDEMLSSESGSESSNGSMIQTFNTFQYSKYRWLVQCRDAVKVLGNARIPVPNNPFFVITIRNYNLDGCSMTIPLSFARAHLRCRSGGFVKVKVDDGRQWSIQCYRNRSRCILCYGWNGLLQEMHLEVGDICLFELTDVKKSVFHLFVLKAS